MMPRWTTFVKGLMLLSLIRLVEWLPALSSGYGSKSLMVPLWQAYNTWFEPTDLWLTDWFAYGMTVVYAALLIHQFLKPSIIGLFLVGIIQFQLHLVLYFFITTADNWRLICLWYALIGLYMNQYKVGHWVKLTFVFHIAIFYYLTVCHKLMYPEWQNGTALSLISWHPLWGELFPSDFASSPMTYATMVIELLLPITWVFKQTRKWGVLLGVLFHASIMVFVPVAGFSLAMIWANVFVLSEEEWTTLLKKLKKRLFFFRLSPIKQMKER
jgi:hypothetical protein